MSDQPFFTILTPTRNRVRLLRKAVESLWTQDFRSFEHRIYDAASTDGTQAMLAEYPGVQLVSERDRGHFDAFNKGLKAARGEVIGLLNSDDFFLPGTLAAVAEAFRDPAVEVVTGGSRYVVETAEGGHRTVREFTQPRELALTVHNMLAGVPLINARFYRRSFVERVGFFDLDFPIASDRDWLVSAALAGPKEVILDCCVYAYLEHEDSLTIHDTGQNVLSYQEEHVALAEKHLARELPPAARRELRRFHRYESACVAAAHWRKGSTEAAQAWMERGRAVSALWPLIFWKRLLGMALGR